METSKIDYGVILRFLERNQGVPYKNPESPELSADERQRLLRIKEEGQAAVSEMGKIPEVARAQYSLDLDTDRKPSWLDTTRTKTSRYLWIQLRHKEYMDDPICIAVFAEKRDGLPAYFRVSLERKDKGATDELIRYHSYLSMPLDSRAGLVYVTKVDGEECPVALNEDKTQIQRIIESEKNKKIQLSKFIEQTSDMDNEAYGAQIMTAINAILPYYHHVIGKGSEWPSLEEYDPHISADQWLKLLKDGDVTWDDNLRMLKMMLKQGGECTCSRLAAIYGGSPMTYNAWGKSFGQRVQKATGCALFETEDRIRYYTIPFVGRSVTEDGKKHYSWKIRDELKEALKAMDLSNVDITAQNAVEQAYDRNLILYGPPGTGKTYHSVTYAVAICDGKKVEDLTDYEAVMKRYNELKAAGRIAFTTFHQSYGYEEFIEGIKPQVDEESSIITYTIESGVFKKFCERAAMPGREEVPFTGTVWNIRSRAKDSDVKFAYDDYLYTEGAVIVEDINDRNRQCNFLTNLAKGDLVVLGRDFQIFAVGVVTDDVPEEIDRTPFHWKRNVNWLAKNLNLTLSDIGMGGTCFSNFAVAKSPIPPQNLLSMIQHQEAPMPYVFIIDEINRGNISKIFGELLTLIEDTKRKGMPEAMEAILPYSREMFSVPENVYLLGTMNTADRSIASMDTALRRRFRFIEMMPDSEVLRRNGADLVGELDVAKMLDTINERIAFLYDREHTIGHAFFTGLAKNPTIETLAAIFKKSVIPLLQEYFFEDYQKIQLVLGDNAKPADEYKFILDSPVKAKAVFKGNLDDAVDLPEKKYTINPDAFDKLNSYIEIM